ncbi:MULE domain-containing protein [Trichonephila clavata]|uniref:MULE domain-containing protein n=1 Tax=Trichonephila clavata TaxID=2740835 RepID=A0A8X6KS42_TRICU|nr:MULE domain-containing protein [Trichonephila clavata]
MAGSNKINGNCPSKMKVYEDIESKVTVEFTKTHVGHGIDLGQMKITEEKEDIVRKLENKIPVEAILDDIRNSVNQKLERIPLIRQQDIKEEYNINSDSILDANDVVSITKWVEGLKNREDSPIVLFKDQKIFDEDLYPGMNASLKDMLKFYGNDTICLDFTRGMNAYMFDLATLLVLDDERE